MSETLPDRSGELLRVPARFPTRVVKIGDLAIGGEYPILVQSMTISDTMRTDDVVAEIRALVDAGCPLVRLTAPSKADAQNIREIRRRLDRDGVRVPLVADIHFTPSAALVAAEIVEKVRINPGNYADRKKFEVFEISDAAYASELARIRERVLPLVRRLKDTGAALRIGTNHGSLSDRILNRYGDTPEGMVESALEFVRICEDESYHDIVLSMKSSIPSVMIAAYRLLVQRMSAEGMSYPIHLGVTEAGDGIEGRIKSAIGIGSLLASGIGDTIRVSLTEDSHHEIPAARNILEAIAIERDRALADGDREAESAVHAAGAALPNRVDRAEVESWRTLSTLAWSTRRRSGVWDLPGVSIGGTHPIRIERRVHTEVPGASDADATALLGAEAAAGRPAELMSIVLDPAASSPAEANDAVRQAREAAPGVSVLVECATRPDPAWIAALASGVDAVGLHAVDASDVLMEALSPLGCPIRWRLATGVDPAPTVREILGRAGGRSMPTGFVLTPGPGYVSRGRALGDALAESDALVFLEAPADGASLPVAAGTLITEGIGDAICLVTHHPDGRVLVAAPPWPAGGVPWTRDPVSDAYRLLQACRVRLTRAEFIACPSCGRTQFDLQATTARIRRRTQHLEGVKIAIMGCIVNGPGEMADADFGYVGSGRGRVDLYVGKERVARNIPADEAEDRLVDLLDAHGAWVSPPEPDGGAEAPV